ncbi:MAG: elongation factor P maturation arginine rhamnosyltransferase EarP [Burkholderiales bacterium]|nr:elongation factor P maturation arginine rhamnosyltransferase EarP [Burkholderiales bacterium]MBY0576823.1 elongation factor P maturation arginine rhamnosyltransferase EarP [Gallionellaceae bacterium]
MAVPRSWDIFCRVVDNLGDIGVSWRLARQLAGEQHAAVRLWVDDLASLRVLCPRIAPADMRQHVEKIEVLRWQEPFSAVIPAEIAIEAFGCGLPEAYIAAMVERNPRTLWITLEYLSAETWVREHHGLPSPHPRWPLARYFFFPGFVAGTGGVLREADLLARRDAFGDAGRERFWASVGFRPPAAGAEVVSLFAYDNAPVGDLLAAWERGEELTVVAVPEGKIVGAVLGRLGVTAAEAGRIFRRGSLEVRIVPFVAQPRYDELLWACDCNFVRGEDSFVRAQWAAKPMVWQIYPQQERAHWPKLEAFLDLYCEGLPGEAAAALRGMWRAWNSVGAAPVAVGEAWRAFRAQRTALEARASGWAQTLFAAGELSEKLAQFCQDKLKYRF